MAARWRCWRRLDVARRQPTQTLGREAISARRPALRLGNCPYMSRTLLALTSSPTSSAAFGAPDGAQRIHDVFEPVLAGLQVGCVYVSWSGKGGRIHVVPPIREVHAVAVVRVRVDAAAGAVGRRAFEPLRQIRDIERDVVHQTAEIKLSVARVRVALKAFTCVEEHVRPVVVRVPTAAGRAAFGRGCPSGAGARRSPSGCPRWRRQLPERVGPSGDPVVQDLRRHILPGEVGLSESRS